MPAPMVIGIAMMWAACLTPMVVAAMYIADVTPGHWRVMR